MGTRQRKFSGCIFGCEVNEAGVKTGEIFSFGELSTMTLDIQQELVKAISNMCGTAGQTVNSRPKPAVASGAMTCEEWVPDVVVEGLGATVAAQTISSSTLTDEDITLVGFTHFAEIGTKRLSSVVVKDSVGGDTLVEGVDYVIEEYLGLIRPVEGSSYFPLGTEHCFISATGDEDTTPVYTIGAGTSGTFRIFGKVEDAWSGKAGELLLRKTRMVLTNSVPFVAGKDDELSPLEFEVSPEIVTGMDGFGTFAGEVLA